MYACVYTDAIKGSTSDKNILNRGNTSKSKSPATPPESQNPKSNYLLQTTTTYLFVSSYEKPQY